MTADPFANLPNADDSLNGEFSPARTKPPVRAYDILDRAHRVWQLLAKAHDAGLPMPGYVTIGAHEFGDYRSSAIKFQMASAEEVSRWALHFEVKTVTSKKSIHATIEQTGHHDIEAYHMFPEPAPKPAPEWSARLAEQFVPGLAEHTQAADLASCGHPRNEDGECNCSSWPERAPSVPGLDDHTQAAPSLADALKSSLAAHTQAAQQKIIEASR